MDAALMARVFIDLQKKALDNFFEAWAISQGLATKTARIWTRQMGISEKIHDYAERWRTILDQERVDSRKRIDEGLKIVESYLNGLPQGKPANNSRNQPAG